MYPSATLMLVALALMTTTASAVPVYWNTWTSASAGSLSVDGEAVSLAFDTSNDHARVANYPSWSPLATFADGSLVNNGPAQENGIMQLTGGTTAINRLAFSRPVVDPVMSIWSLGRSSAAASFNFIGATPILVSGGPNAEYGGSTLAITGNTVSGHEGNGTIQFKGTFSELAWTNPISENWYGFNAGVANVPEPETCALMLAGLGLAAFVGRRRGRKACGERTATLRNDDRLT